MPPTPVEAGRSFAEALKAKAPALSAQVDALLGSEIALTELGRGVLMREDHSRLMNETQRVKEANDAEFARLKTEETRQKAWWETAQEDVELGRRAKAANWKPTDPDPNNPDPSKRTTTGTGLTLEDVNKQLTEREVGQALFVTTLTDLSQKHLKRFGEVLDTNALVKEIMTDPQAKERGLLGHYTHKYAAQIAASDKAIADADFDRRYKERRAEEIKNQTSGPPYPTGGRVEPGSPLDALEPVKTATGTSVPTEDLVAEYNRLVEQGQAGR